MIETPTGWLHYAHYIHHYVQVSHWLEEPVTRAVSQHMSIFQQKNYHKSSTCKNLTF